MRLQHHLRAWWSRLTLASKLTISYLAPLVVIAISVSIIGSFLVALQMQRTGRETAQHTADSLAELIQQAARQQHSAKLSMEAESVARVLEQLPSSGAQRDAAMAAYLTVHAQHTTTKFFIVRDSGEIIYHPFGDEPISNLRFIPELSADSSGEPASFVFDNPIRPDAGDLFNAYATRVEGTDAHVVAAEPEPRMLAQLPGDALGSALAITGASAVAAVILDDNGHLVANSQDWSEWSEGTRSAMSETPHGAVQVQHRLGTRRRYLAWQSMPALHATVGVIYDADDLEGLLGRVVLLFGASALLAMVTVPVLSRVAAVFVTAPVNRATRYLARATGGTPQPKTGDELAKLVRQLLRTSVKLDYEHRHREQAEDELGITATVYRNIGEGIVVLESDGTISRVNPAFTAIAGYSTADLRGKTPAVLMPADKQAVYFDDVRNGLERHGEWQGEVLGIRKSGEHLPILLSVRTVFGPAGEQRGFIAVVRDISDIKTTQDRLEHLASHDPLTDLPNRTYLSDSLEQILETRRRRGGGAAVLFLDVDHFKDVNDAHGHHAGDELLQIIASRLRATVRTEDIISRFGGDEFVVILTDPPEAGALDEIVRRMLNRIREPARIEDITVRPSATAGIAMFPESGSNAEDLLKNADAAMYQAKRIGRGSYRYHDPEMNESLNMRLAVQDRVRRGLRTDEFVLYWQPVFSVTNPRMVGAEALIRWRQDGEVFNPGTFMPYVEGSQTMLELGEWVINETVETLAVNEDALPESFRVAINVSAIEIIQRGFVTTVIEALARHGVGPERLGIEVTEGAVVRDVPTAQRAIQELQAHGIRVYLDDFGVGYSSLQYLREFGVDAVKLDKSFLTEVPDSISACSLVRGFVDLAHGLGLRTTIEGVETAQQVDYLRSIGCDTMQGFHPGRPVPAEELIRTLSSGTADTR